MTSVQHAPRPISPPALIRPDLPPWVAVLIACVSSFMVVMDGAIVNVALPGIQAGLGLTALQLQWVVDAYLLCLGGFMLLAARASDLYGRKPVLLGGLTVFTLGSLLGGLADSGPVLLAARAVQGIGASALATSTLALIVAVYPSGPARGKAISAWAASSSVASACGVLAGGVLTAQLGWRWVMFVNVPIGVALILAVAACIQRSSQARSGKLDLPGAASVTLGMASLLYGISQAASLGWSAPLVLVALGMGACLLLAFCIIESRSAQPLLQLSIFRLPNVRNGNVVVMGLGAALTASTYFMSILLQQVLGMNAQDSGLCMAPMAAALAVAAIVSRPMMDAGVRQLPCYGGLIAAAGLLCLSQCPLQATYRLDILGPSMLIGLGLGLMLMTAAHTALDGIAGKEAGIASGLFNTARQLGGTLGIAGLSTLAHGVATQQAAGAHAAGLAACHAAFVGIAVLLAVAALMSLRLKPLAD
ncbi:MFS transporter [Chitinimonas sp.]|uniref:MFS transporter n=1 Tax=Chitinimonas sp. TaxID=1934313 RepID=UPI0035AECBD4